MLHIMTFLVHFIWDTPQAKLSTMDFQNDNRYETLKSLVYRYVQRILPKDTIFYTKSQILDSA